MKQNSFPDWSKFEEFMKITRPKIKRQFLLCKMCFFNAVAETERHYKNACFI